MAAGYDNYREKGGVVGRKEGYRKRDFQYLKQYEKELDLLRRGMTYKDTMTITGTCVNTLRKLKSKYLA